MYRVTQPARTVIGALEHRADLLEQIEAVADQLGIVNGTFHFFGAVYRADLAVWDTETTAYVTTKIEHFCEITAGLGTISKKEGSRHLHCHLTLVDKEGRVYGGHLMPGSRLFAGEYWIQELDGPAIERAFEAERGLWLWAETDGGAK